MMQTVGSQGYMQPMQQATPAASAVNIQIFEPKAYGGQPQQNVQAPIYAYPEQSMYTQPYMNQYQQYMPVAPQPPMMMPEQMAVDPYAQATTPITQPQQQTEIVPVPQQTQMPETHTVQQPQEPQIQEQPQPAVQTGAQQAQAPGSEVDSIVANLQSTDNATQENAITQIATMCMGTPEQQSAVLSEPVMQTLAGIAAQDTSGLQGPTEAQVAAINKSAAGEQLTPEEQTLVNELPPKTMADKNKVISMFTLAMLQKNQRDEIDKYNQTQDPANQLTQIKAQDLIGFNEIQNAARSESEKEVKLAAIQALSYMARPEDKEVLEPILTTAAQDSEPLIQQAANEVLANIGGAAAPAQTAQPTDPQAAPAQPQEGEQVDVSQMSKKERKAYEKAQKKAAKQAEKEAKQVA